MARNFTWVPFYQELARELTRWEKRQQELVSFLEDLRTQGFVITPLEDKDGDGGRSLLSEIDPFTFFGVFNRRIAYDQRLAILAQIKNFFHLQSELPEDLDGIPLLNNRKSWFIANQLSREAHDVERLWRLFHLALQANPLESEDFLQAFDEALTVKQTNVNLTMGLFWIRPDMFLSLDQTNRLYLGLRLPEGGLNARITGKRSRPSAAKASRSQKYHWQPGALKTSACAASPKPRMPSTAPGAASTTGW